MFKMTPESQKLNPQTPDGVPCKPQTPNPKPLIKPKPSCIMILGCWAEGGRRPVTVWAKAWPWVWSLGNLGSALV